MVRDGPSSGFGLGRSQTFRLDRPTTSGDTVFKDSFDMGTVTKKHLIIGGVVFFLACMIIILVALSVTIATHRKFYYGFTGTGGSTGDGGGDGGTDGGGGTEEMKVTDIPCAVQGETCEQYGCKIVENPEMGSHCYLVEDAFGYKYRHTTYGDRGMNFSLTYDVSKKSPLMADVIHNVKVEVVYVTEEILRFKIHDEDRGRYEVPVLGDSAILRNMPKVERSRLRYMVDANSTNKGYAKIRLLRSDNQIVMLDSWHLIMTEQYLQIVLPYGGQQVYGFGENDHDDLMLGVGNGTMFSKFRNNSTKEWSNFAGVHPFYMNPKGDGTTWAVLLLNSNAMDYTVTSTGEVVLAAIGGILDMYFFVGSTPNHVVQLYHQMIGFPFLPPFWALGYQHWMRSYATLDKLKAAVNALTQDGVPKDSVWVDISQQSRAFTLSANFKGFAAYVNELENSGVRVILITTPAIAADNGTTYKSGLEDDVFVKRGDNRFAPDGKAVHLARGYTPGLSAFPDFLKNATKFWWRDQLEEYHANVASFDGIYLGLNEPAEFSGSMVCAADATSCQVQVCPQGRWETPPYVPYAYMETGNESLLHEGTLCMSCIQGEDDQQYRHYDVHSIYGWSQSQVTKWALGEITNLRSLVVSDSTYPSSGRYAGHILPSSDEGEWSSLRRAIIGALEFNMFGIPYVGAAICNRTTSELLCQRWTELGSFFPLSVDFRTKDSSMDRMQMSPVALNATLTRYHFLGLLYTLFYRANVSGGAVMRPLFFEFPLDRTTYDIAEQFMWGSAILISPILAEDATTHAYYLPLDTWYEYPSGRRVEGSVDMITRSVTDNSTLLIHMRAGNVVPVQPTLKAASDRAKAPFDLHVYPKEGFATGELFVDDGVTQGTIEGNMYDLFSFVLSQDLLRISISHVGVGNRQNVTLKNVVFFDRENAPSRVSLNRNYLHQDFIKHDNIMKTLTVIVNLQLKTLSSLSTEALLQIE